MRWFRRRDDRRPESTPAPATARVPRRVRRAEPAGIVGEPDWRAYNAIAEAYAKVQAPRTALPAVDLVRLAGVESGHRVLDVGTGTGVVARAAAEAAGAAGVVVGIDKAPAMLVAAADEDGRVCYAAAEALDLPFRDGTFDVVLAGFVLPHFRKYETALFDMVRVLRPGGRLGVSVWGAGDDEFSRAWNEVAELMTGKEILRDAYRRAMPWSERFSDPNRLKDALYDAGIREKLAVERREYRFDETAEEYLLSKEIAALGRFLHQMLGEMLWERFRARTREVFASRFPPRFNDFRDVILAAGTKG